MALGYLVIVNTSVLLAKTPIYKDRRAFVIGDVTIM